MMTRPAAVLFDCDGVIVDSEPPAARLVAADLRSRGLEMTDTEIATAFTGSTMVAMREAVVAAGVALPEDWITGMYGQIYAELASGVPLIPGIESVLDALDAAGIPYALGSNGRLEKMDITLGQYPALKARFEGHIHSAQALGAPKPDPAVYLHAAKQLGVDPLHCVVVDDSRFGCMAGVRAGMRTMGFAEHGDGAALKAVGAEVFHHMDELPALLGL